MTLRSPDPAVAPAVPSTPAQHDRRERILDCATAALRAGGDALQMKELAQCADVSLATLYRYFPAKDHVLLAVTLSRYQRALARIQAEAPLPGTVRERVTSHLLREFAAGQREPRLTGALSRAVSETSRSYSTTIRQIERVHLQIIAHVAAAGTPLSTRHEAVLPVVADVFTAAADTIELHGGIGFTWEHDAHLYYKNALSGKVLLGGPAAQLDRLAATLAP